jgi:hypothetical protein
MTPQRVFFDSLSLPHSAALCRTLPHSAALCRTLPHSAADLRCPAADLPLSTAHLSRSAVIFRV